MDSSDVGESILIPPSQGDLIIDAEITKEKDIDEDNSACLESQDSELLMSGLERESSPNQQTIIDEKSLIIDSKSKKKRSSSAKKSPGKKSSKQQDCNKSPSKTNGTVVNGKTASPKSKIEQSCTCGNVKKSRKTSGTKNTSANQEEKRANMASSPCSCVLSSANNNPETNKADSNIDLNSSANPGNNNNEQPNSETRLGNVKKSCTQSGRKKNKKTVTDEGDEFLDEDILDNFAILSFMSLEDLQKFEFEESEKVRIAEEAIRLEEERMKREEEEKERARKKEEDAKRRAELKLHKPVPTRKIKEQKNKENTADLSVANGLNEAGKKEITDSKYRMGIKRPLETDSDPAEDIGAKKLPKTEESIESESPRKSQSVPVVDDRLLSPVSNGVITSTPSVKSGKLGSPLNLLKRENGTSGEGSLFAAAEKSKPLYNPPDSTVTNPGEINNRQSAKIDNPSIGTLNLNLPQAPPNVQQNSSASTSESTGLNPFGFALGQPGTSGLPGAGLPGAQQGFMAAAGTAAGLPQGGGGFPFLPPGLGSMPGFAFPPGLMIQPSLMNQLSGAAAQSAGSASRNSLPTPTHPPAQSSQKPLASTSSSGSAVNGQKKTGKWCAMHVRIAWDIYKQEQERNKSKTSGSTESPNAGPSSATPTTGAAGIQKQDSLSSSYRDRSSSIPGNINPPPRVSSAASNLTLNIPTGSRSGSIEDLSKEKPMALLSDSAAERHRSRTNSKERDLERKHHHHRHSINNSTSKTSLFSANSLVNGTSSSAVPSGSSPVEPQKIKSSNNHHHHNHHYHSTSSSSAISVANLTESNSSSPAHSRTPAAISNPHHASTHGTHRSHSGQPHERAPSASSAGLQERLKLAASGGQSVELLRVSPQSAAGSSRHHGELRTQGGVGPLTLPNFGGAPMPPHSPAGFPPVSLAGFPGGLDFLKASGLAGLLPPGATAANLGNFGGAGNLVAMDPLAALIRQRQQLDQINSGMQMQREQQEREELQRLQQQAALMQRVAVQQQQQNGFSPGMGQFGAGEPNLASLMERELERQRMLVQAAASAQQQATMNPYAAAQLGLMGFANQGGGFVNPAVSSAMMSAGFQGNPAGLDMLRAAGMPSGLPGHLAATAAQMGANPFAALGKFQTPFSNTLEQLARQKRDNEHALNR